MTRTVCRSSCTNSLGSIRRRRLWGQTRRIRRHAHGNTRRDCEDMRAAAATKHLLAIDTHTQARQVRPSFVSLARQPAAARDTCGAKGKLDTASALPPHESRRPRNTTFPLMKGIVPDRCPRCVKTPRAPPRRPRARYQPMFFGLYLRITADKTHSQQRVHSVFQ